VNDTQVKGLCAAETDYPDAMSWFCQSHDDVGYKFIEMRFR